MRETEPMLLVNSRRACIQHVFQSAVGNKLSAAHRVHNIQLYHYTHERWMKFGSEILHQKSSRTIPYMGIHVATPNRRPLCDGFEFISKEPTGYYSEKRGEEIHGLRLSTQQFLTPSLREAILKMVSKIADLGKVPSFTHDSRTHKYLILATNAQFTTSHHFIPSRKKKHKKKRKEKEREGLWWSW